MRGARKSVSIQIQSKVIGLLPLLIMTLFSGLPSSAGLGTGGDLPYLEVTDGQNEGCRERPLQKFRGPRPIWGSTGECGGSPGNARDVGCCILVLLQSYYSSGAQGLHYGSVSTLSTELNKSSGAMTQVLLYKGIHQISTGIFNWAFICIYSLMLTKYMIIQLKNPKSNKLLLF